MSYYKIPPIAKRIKHSQSVHGLELIDYYHWIRLTDEEKESGSDNPHTSEVTQYLQAENAYTKQFFQPYKSEIDEIFTEIKSRFSPDDQSVPYNYNGYTYFREYKNGLDHPIYLRKEIQSDKSEILLDVNFEAAKHAYYVVGSLAVSPDNNILAYSEDNVSRRQYRIRFKNLRTGKILPDYIENTTGNFVWAEDNLSIFYSKRDAALRPSMIYRHTLGNIAPDTLIYEEKEEAFYAGIGKTRSGKYLVIQLWSTISQEFRILRSDNPEGEFVVFQTRKPHLEYSIDHHEDHWYVRTNLGGASNFQLMVTTEQETSAINWVNYWPYQSEYLLEDIDCFAEFMVLSLRNKGKTQIGILRYGESKMKEIDFPEVAFHAYLGNNKEFSVEKVRIMYTSLVSPVTTYDYDIQTNSLEVLKQEPVLGGFDPERYSSEKWMVEGRDGTQIPLSIVWNNQFNIKQSAQPILLYGYGSYGSSMDPYFSSARLSLLDRGMAFAIAHIRGGEEMGRNWYKEGKLLHKKNTFNDFIDCGKYLIQAGFTTVDQLCAMGGSAGGLLMGAVMNMEPTLWKAVVAAVPFVDVINTMLDASIPLTTGEYNEWGNPNERVFFDYILSYSPYDNVSKKDYPDLLITTGYHDSQVQYWEPAKWIAKLRHYNPSHKEMYLLTNMDTGHGGESGRFQRYKEIAQQYVFLLVKVGIIPESPH